MKQIIYKVANELGFDAIGISSNLNYDYLKPILNNRIQNNYYNELQEQDVEKRLYIKNVFPDCKSIITVGIPYAKGYRNINSRDKGRISVISFGEDYHHIVNKSLEQFARKLSGYFNFKYKICVDTSPLVDKEICRESGIGDYGKNSLLINKNLGSFMSLGYLLTDIKLEVEQNNKFIDICKDCDICIKACPNNAILENGIINTKKCISYLTQTKNYIPIEYRNNMGNQIYGCDICQIVCPKNKKILFMETTNNYDELLVDLNELLTISNSLFLNKYKNTSGGWRGKNIWKRNAIISIANLDLKNMFYTLKEELNNPSAMIKIYASWALIELNKNKSIDILNNSIKYEDDIIKNEYKRLLEDYK